MRHRGRLYWRIWFAVLASLIVFTLLAVAAWRFLGERTFGPNVRAWAEVAGSLLPPATAPLEDQRAAVHAWHEKLHADLALFEADGTPIAATAPDLRSPPDNDEWLVTRHGPAFALHLPDGRVLVTRRNGSRPPPPLGLMSTLLLLALAVGIGAYPVARRITGRLERLQAGVDRLGQGDLAARVKVEGRDEIAQLATRFNAAAERIEQLMQSHRALLANASHELRSPLARVRMAAEMLGADARPDLKRELERDIAELDALIDEILLSSRLDATDARGEFERLDFTALVAEECARIGAQLTAQPVAVRGSARLLHRMVRNLLENAQRYGDGTPVDVNLSARERVVLDVCDRGRGIASDERERIFEPFYRARGATESTGGVGLGLALVRKVAEQHDGRVECLGRDGGGSVFRVTLPRAAD
jgi:signal transduction histidine kinase